MAEPKKTILIFGVSSFIGSNLAESLKKDYKVVGTFYENPIHIKDVLTVRANLLIKEEIYRLFNLLKPDIVIFSIGFSSLNDAHEARKYHELLSNTCLYYVIESCQRNKSKFIYFSSAYVFSGEMHESFSEADIPIPKTPFGKVKTSAELFIQKTCTNYIIFRLAQMYGRNAHPRIQTWFEKLQYMLFLGRNFGCDDIHSLGFLDVNYLSMIIKLCIETGATNRLFQVSSKDAMTYFDFARIYAQIFNADIEFIGRQKWPFPLLTRAKREGPELPRSFLLNVSNIENYLSIKMPTIEESLRYTFDRLGGNKLLIGAKVESSGVNYL